MKALRIFLLLIISVTATQLYAQSNVVPDQDEFDALKDLWTSTAGSSWTTKTNWPTTGNWPSSATATQMDAWFGIVVTNGDITEITMTNNNLNGPLPASMANLAKLSVLNLMNNRLSGTIPTWLGNLTALTFLRLDNNLYTGSIPSELNNLTALQTLAIGGTTLTGTIPDLSGLAALKSLNFSGNPFTLAAIPSWLSSLTNLEEINLNGTNRNGTIPDLSALTHLKALALNGNYLTGEFPVSLTQLSGLQNLQLGINQLSGNLPHEIGDLTALGQLDIMSNKFTGAIPKEINNLHNLWDLELYDNQFTGIPSDLSGLTSLVTCYVYNNQIEGNLPRFATSVPTLTAIRFNNNKITGPIPSTYGTLTNVTELRLQDNKLTGNIPSELGSMANLAVLLLQNNQLCGVLPSALGALTKLTSLYLYNNKFSGEIPSSFSGLTKMVNFNLYNNEFSGVVPSIFTYMTNLFVLNIDNNLFNGTLPVLRGSTISLVNNSFTGAFPSITNTVGSPVVSVNASSNGFTSIAGDVSAWPSLTSLNFSNNELTSLPTALQTHSNKANLLLNVTNNRLDYAAVTPYKTGFKSPVSLLPQKNIKDHLTQTMTIGSQLILTASAVGAASVFWEKQDLASAWGAPATDQDSDPQTYTRTSATKADEGIYRWKMTSTDFQNTAIYSEPIQVKSAVQFALDNWGFQYRYDERKRVTHKKVPGADWVYMVYDKRDRLVMTQDGEQRKVMKWTFTRYDELNRPIVTGLYTHDAVIDQSTMTGLLSPSVFGETFTGTGDYFGYSNTVMSAFPGKFEPLSVMYYDNYDFLNGDPYFGYKPGETEGQLATAISNVKGLATGTWSRILGAERQWLRAVNYYDDKYRVVQSITDNHKRGQDVTTSVYDFVGKVLRTKTASTEHRINWGTPLHQNVKLLEDRIMSTANATPYAFSAQQIGQNANGWVEFTLSSNETIASIRTFGLSVAGTTTTSYVAYGVKQTRGISPVTNTIQVFEGTSSKGLIIDANGGDVIRITRIGNVMYYLRNGYVFYTGDPITGTLPALKAHGVITTLNGDLYNPRISVAGLVQSTERSFVYDHVGRLLKTYHSIDGASMVLLSEQSYNKLGQIVDKKLHSVDATTYRQSIDYRYNIRGWLASVNGAELGNNNGKNDNDSSTRKDLFGMDLLYNDATVEGIGNTPMYNGNISSMKWSTNLGAGTVKQRAYKFDYDAMNRLTSAAQKTYKTAWTASGAFHESGVTYDLNGNIQTLRRTDANSTQMDNLTYTYGTGDVASNLLLRVDDSGNTGGFANGTNVDDDYGYDNNGNMIADKNKSISSISYNHLNLPVKITKATGDYLVYTYDATGRKLAQDVYNPSNTLIKRTDYRGEWFLENDTVKFVNHEEGRAVVEGEWTQAPQLMPNSTMATTTGYVAEGNVTLTSQTIEGRTYMKVTSNQNGNYPGFSSDQINVKPGGQYTVKIKGYRTSTAGAQFWVIGYGSLTDYLDAPAPSLASGSGSDGWITSTFTVPTSMNKIRVQILLAPGVVNGDVFYVDAIELYEYHPGHGTEVFTQSGYTYQYHLKDHLGNVRMTFTTKDETDAATATLETAHQNEDASNFLNYDKARLVYSSIFDNTNGASPGYSQRLSGSPNEKVGLARSFAVMPGDVIRAEVQAKYFDATVADPAAAILTIINSLANPAESGGQIVDGLGYNLSVSTNAPWTWGNGHQADADVPEAYLNYIYINKDFDPNSVKPCFKAISVAALENGSNGPHETLTLEEVVEEAGYVYVYLSNDGETEKEVYFDDFKVEHVKSPVVSSQDYYPFGLTFNSYSRENSLANQYQYNGKELQDELDLQWLDYQARQYDPAIARWMAPDPLSSLSRRWSPYAYCYNNPLLFVDPDGMFGDYYDSNGKKIGTDGKDDGKKYIVLDKDQARGIEKTDKKGGVTDRSTVSSSIENPSDEVMAKTQQAIEATDQNGGNEHSFAAATDGSTSDVRTDGNPDHVAPGPGYDQLAAAGKTGAFDVHVHGSGENGATIKSTNEPSGSPGDRITEGDFGYKGLKERQGLGSEPNWVIGTKNSQAERANGQGGTDVVKSSERQVIFYRNSGVVGRMEWNKFQKTVNRVNGR